VRWMREEEADRNERNWYNMVPSSSRSSRVNKFAGEEQQCQCKPGSEFATVGIKASVSRLLPRGERRDLDQLQI
jgi:hypothetical protein